MEIKVEKEAERLGIAISAGTLEDATVRKSRKEVLELLFKELKKEIRERIGSIEELRNDPVIRSLRDLYWRIGIDPTRTRPSSEALVRRVFRKGLPMINNLVDAGNLASARSFIPIGLYNMDAIEGESRIEITKGGEIFRGIGGKDQTLEPGIPVLSDEAGVLHLYPHRDCRRTRITEDTESVLMVSCGVKGIRKRQLNEALAYVRHYCKELEVWR
jgi:DNA/RNA-binding domain of Phe-tRNA-synthetase-like protein